jgi:hypothetical protein
MIDNLVEKLQPNIDHNYQVWPIMQYLLLNNLLMNTGFSYPEEIMKLKSWIEERSIWMDENIADIYYPVTTPQSIPFTDASDEESIYCFPNPFSEYLSLKVFLNDPAIVTIELYDLTGRISAPVVRQEMSEHINEIQFTVESSLPPGMYIIYAFKNQNLFAFQRVTKIK